MALAYIFTPRPDGEPGAHKEVMALDFNGTWYAVAGGKWGENLTPFSLQAWAFEFEQPERMVCWDGWDGGMFAPTLTLENGKEG